MEKHHKFSIWYVLIGIWAVLIAQNYLHSMFAVQTIPYSQFLSLLKEGRVTEIAVSQNRIEGKMKAEGGTAKAFRAVRVDPELSNMLEQYHVTFKGEVESTFFQDLLSWVLPLFFFIGIWIIYLLQ